MFDRAKKNSVYVTPVFIFHSSGIVFIFDVSNRVLFMKLSPHTQVVVLLCGCNCFMTQSHKIILIMMRCTFSQRFSCAMAAVKRLDRPPGYSAMQED